MIVQKKIVVVGSINLDLVASVARLPAAGETMTGTAFATYPGGKGANQAVAAARLGVAVAMIGRLGDDSFAAQLLAGLESAGVNTECVETVAGASGSAVILVTPEGENSIVVIPGANHALRPPDLDKHLKELQTATVILAQLESPMETVDHLGSMAASLGIPFLLDPAPAQGLSPETLKNVTWLTPNEGETCSILQHLGVQVLSGDMNDEAVAFAAQQILASGVQNVIIKRGSRGVYLAGRDVVSTYIPSFPVEAVDTTAAGDAFNGGFACGLAQGWPALKAARFACAVAAVCVTRAGAQPSMPTLAEVFALLAGPSKAT
jgi:ribokinase